MAKDMTNLMYNLVSEIYQNPGLSETELYEGYRRYDKKYFGTILRICMDRKWIHRTQLYAGSWQYGYFITTLGRNKLRWYTKIIGKQNH